MTAKKILLALVLPAIVLMMVYSATQLAKGAAPQEAVEFAVLWTAITLGIFHGARAYYRRTGQNCKVEKS